MSKKSDRRLNLMRLYYFTIGVKGSVEALNLDIYDWENADTEQIARSQAVYDYATTVRDLVDAIAAGNARYRDLARYVRTVERYHPSREIRHLAKAMLMILKEV